MKDRRFRVTIVLDYYTHSDSTKEKERTFFHQIVNDATAGLDRLVTRGDLQVEEISEGAPSEE